MVSQRDYWDSVNLQPGGEYIVEVEEDPKHAPKDSKPYKAASSSRGGGFGFGRAGGASASVTDELKKMSAAELKAASSGGEGAARYRALLEARDLEDAMGGDDDLIMGEDSSSCSCLFGNPCVSPYCCKDWRNRFEVAKRNGWKGHD